MMMTGSAGWLALMRGRRSMPEPPACGCRRPGTCGSSVASAVSTSRGFENERTAYSSRASAFSSTKRMD
jgi:hypothetical protein